MIIDIHTHCFPDNLAHKAVSFLGAKARFKPYANGTVANLKEIMVQGKIDKSVIMPIATKPEQTPVINRWVQSVSDQHIISFGTLHPHYEKWRDEIKWFLDQGIKGIKFHPDYQNFFVDEPKLFPIYEKIFDAGLIILFHAGIDVGLPDPCHCTPQRLKKVIDSFPGAVIIAAHMGGYGLWKEVTEVLIGKNIYFDTSMSYQKLGAIAMKKMILAHGCDKILFGTDSPWSSPDVEISNLKSLNLNAADLNLILGGNAQRILNLP
ncbi:MAG: amidohydrolase family protein [Bacillota bacterium]|jgi:predicted TIM-barrel fold metal-dependent hydrolase|nr:amidohydrolase family protein [Clostridia bacterium]